MYISLDVPEFQVILILLFNSTDSHEQVTNFRKKTSPVYSSGFQS